MESSNGLQTLKAKQDPSEDIAMETLSPVDLKINSQEKSTTFMDQSFVHNSTFILSTTEKRMQEQAKTITPSKLVAAVIIMVVIGIFSVPIIIYYTLKSDPIPELNSTLGDVNISMVNLFHLDDCIR